MNENELLIEITQGSELEKKGKRARKYPKIPDVIDEGYQLATPSCPHQFCGCEEPAATAEAPNEETIRKTAYFIWEASGKVKASEDCWIEAKKILGLE